MSSKIQFLNNKNLIKPPHWLSDNMHMETMMGSTAYGVSSNDSDIDIYGFCIPPKEIIFPNLAGYIEGFSRQIPKFDQFQQHHVKYDDGNIQKSYDLTIFSIIRYFYLLMDNNPNVIDSIFTPIDCVQHITQIGNLVRDNRKLFLHKGLWHRYRGYSYSQLAKMEGKEYQKGSKRAEDVEKHGYSTKFGYHVVRLLNEAEDALTNYDIDLRKNNEILKSIRRGEWTPQQIRDWATSKEKELEQVYHNSKLPYSPDEPKIKQLLIDCLEIHYGSLEKVIINPDKYKVALEQILEISQKSLI